MATNNDNTADSTPRPSRPPCVFILKLHESPHKDGNYDKYRMQWILDDADDTGVDLGIQEGDMLHIPELASGAGEMESVRIVGQPSGSNGFVLLPAGIESPVFPRGLVERAESPQELRRDYEGLLEVVLQQQGFSLVDLFGGQEVVEEFWANPDVERNPTKETHGDWHISLSECQVLSTHS